MESDCIFCNKEKFAGRIIDENTFCYSIVDRAQWKKCWGHVLVILKNHREDITDNRLSDDELNSIMCYVSKLSKALKDLLNESASNKVERIYVCSLCDGVRHLHFHLLPRYKFDDKDKLDYFTFFEGKKRPDVLKKEIEDEKMGGFWYLFREERERVDYPDDDERLSNFAKKLKDKMKNGK